MDCPKCGKPMRERERETVVLDYCPECSGMWLDAGEFEQLVEIEMARRGNGRDDGPSDGRRQKKEGFFSRLMEGFGGED